MTTTEEPTVFTLASGEVTDADPNGDLYLWAVPQVEPLSEEARAGCAIEEGQTHETFLFLPEIGYDRYGSETISDDDVPVYGSLSEAQANDPSLGGQDGAVLYRLERVM